MARFIKQIARFNCKLTVGVVCDGCKKVIQAGREFAILVKWEVEVDSFDGPFPKIKCSPLPRAIMPAPKLGDPKIRGLTQVISHLNGCIVATPSARGHTLPGCYGMRKRR